MADFELNVDERAFRAVGVGVDFDEDGYSQLLDELAEQGNYAATNSNLTLAVDLEPAPIWGQSEWRKALAIYGSTDKFPSADFTRRTNRISISVDEDEVAANRSLLWITRDMSGIVSGESAAADRARRPISRVALASIPVATAGGAYEGSQHISGGGAIVGGIIGFTVSLAVPIVEMAKRPYRKELRRFVEDPEVLAKYGKVIQFHALSRGGGSEA